MASLFVNTLYPFTFRGLIFFQHVSTCMVLKSTPRFHPLTGEKMTSNHGQRGKGKICRGKKIVTCWIAICTAKFKPDAFIGLSCALIDNLSVPFYRQSFFLQTTLIRLLLARNFLPIPQNLLIIVIMSLGYNYNLTPFYEFQLTRLSREGIINTQKNLCL